MLFAPQGQDVGDQAWDTGWLWLLSAFAVGFLGGGGESGEETGATCLTR